MHGFERRSRVQRIAGVSLALSLLMGTQSLAESPCLGTQNFPLYSDEDIGLIGMAAGAGDFNGDGIPDLAIAGAAQMLLRFGQLNGVGMPSYPTASIVSLTGPNGATPSNPANMKIVDVNADGIPDILVACQTGDGSVLVYRGTGSGGKGDGHFLPPLGVGAGGVWDFEVRDVTNDGALDIILANNAGGLYVYRGLQSAGHPTGQFTFHSGVITTAFPRGLAVADFDQDGALDVAIAPATGTQINVHPGLKTSGLPNGQFGAPSQVTIAGAPFDLVTTDLNGDQDPDLVVSTQNAFDKFMLGGSTGLTFTVLGSLNFGYSTNALGVADLDLDQREDIVVTSNSGQTELAFHDLAGGWPLQFSVKGLTGQMRNQSFALADLNLDGGVDVVVPASLAGHLQIFMNTCGTFPHALSVLVNGSGTAVASPFRTRYATGTPVALTATPAPRQRFDHWSGSISSTSNPIQFAISQTSTVTANFVPDMKTLTLLTEGLGTTSVDPPGGAQLVGTAMKAFAAPAPGYAFEGWTGDIVSDSALIQFQLDRPMTLTAHFIPDATTGVSPGTPRLALAPPRPNPVHGDARVEFTLPTAGHVEVEVLDAFGRVVRHLLDRELSAGPHESRWDGRTDSGGALPAGLYWLRLRTSAEAMTRRFAVLR